MTNNWTDLANSTCVIVMGANPSENHPASMAHINAARAGGNGHPQAKLIVIDPRKTRTAAQADLYVRIRPGTDVAFINGVMNYVINNISGQNKTNWEAYLNSKHSRTFTDDLGVDVVVGTGDPQARSKYTDARFIVAADGLDYKRITHTVGAQTITFFPEVAPTYNEPGVDTVFNKLAEHVAPYDTATVADICGCTEAEVIAVADAYMENSQFASYDPAAPGTIIFDPKSPYYRATTMLYAMGLTQHTHGSQNVKSFANLQVLLGNAGRPGGGINALRGIHNVQGSTDMGLLYHLIPGYSGNPTGTFGTYMDKLYGVRLSGGAVAYDDAYTQTKHGLQQAGFFNMTRKFFGDTTLTSRTDIDKIYALWPKTNGDDHITMFRKMGAGTITAAVAWGQNPAVTEPNQGAIRAGLENLDLLVVVDMFENETAACDRKADGTTYLIPACSYAEEAGSATNSGRVLQWRERARVPAGNSMSDLELLLRFAYALDGAGGFSHISDVWDTIGGFSYSSVYDKLYGSQYAQGWDPLSVTAFEDVAMADVEIWKGASAAPVVGTVYGSEAVSEKIYREMCAQVNAADLTARGTMWIYTLGFAGTVVSPGTGQGGGWTVANRAKSRISTDLDGSGNGHYLYKNWGYAWLVNRRVLYNNGDTPWDQSDGYQGPDQCARLFTSSEGGLIDYAKNYRHIHRLADKPDVALVPGSLHVLPGRLPSHTEPYETPRTDLAATFGRNTKGTGKWDLVKADTVVYAPDDIAGARTGTVPAAIAAAAVSFPAIATPLAMTTIRCVEHFQGGPITRNNPWNVEAEPEPWVEINSIDANARGIKTGDLVDVTTVRSNSTTDQDAITTVAFAQGFRARVGVGLQSNQRVGQGVVAIPWHWGDRGLSTGSRANDLTIDAGDANTVIPEYKACVCWIKKA